MSKKHTFKNIDSNYIKGIPIKITTGYSFLGLIWILFSDKLLASVVSDPILITNWQTYKGLLFLILTSFSLYFLTRKGTTLTLSFYHHLKNQELDLLINKELFNNISQGIVVTDKEQNIINVNAGFTRITGFSRKEVLGEKPTMIELNEDMWRNINHFDNWQGEVWGKRKNGEKYLEHLSMYKVTDSSEEISNYIGILIDLSEVKEKEHTIWEMQDQLHLIIENSPLGIIVVDDSKQIQLWSKQVEEIFKIPQSLARQKDLTEVLPNMANQLMDCIHKVEKQGYNLQKEVEVRFSPENRKILGLSVAPLRKHDQTIYGYQILLTDVTEKKRTEEQMEYLLKYDQLTGLLNYESFQAYILEYLKNEPKESAAFYMIDVDRFKKVNDQYGSDIGDLFIQQISFRLHNILQENGVLGRLMGDEFGLFIPKLKDKQEVKKIADDLQKVFQEPIMVQGYSIHMTVSVGVSVYPFDAKRGETIIKNASLALSRAKRERNTYRFYRDSMNFNHDWFYIENELHKAIKHETLDVYYQPQIDLKTGNLWGLEALVRWNHPQKGMISPGEFIPIAEECGLIIQLGYLVLEKVCQDYQKWKEKGIDIPSISVNLSTKQFFNVGLVEEITKILETYQVPYEVLHLEITESVAMDVTHTLSKLLQLKDLGIKISIDDFGTGYSSIKYLKSLPIDFIKIDRSFIEEIRNDDTSMVKMIIQMASLFNLGVVAEGVETEYQKEFLNFIGCGVAQGYYFAKPLPPEIVLDSIKNVTI